MATLGELSSPRTASRLAHRVLDDQEVAAIVGVDAFVAAVPDEAVEERGVAGQSPDSSTTPPLLPRSCVNRSVRENGSHVEPSTELKWVLPSAPTGVSSVIRWAGSVTSRLMRVM